MDEQQRSDDFKARENKRIKPRNLDCLFAAQHLQENLHQIIEDWETEVRRQMPEASGKSSLVLSNSLPIFLEELVDALKLDNPPKGAVLVEGMSKRHGEQRAILAGYFLPQLLLEFSILRYVITRALFEYESLNFDVQTTVDVMIDSAISIAATEFTKVQRNQVETALGKAEASNEDLQQFAAIAAHDLKSPLATIGGFVGLMRDQILAQNSGINQSLVYIESAVKRMTNLIDQLLEYAQIGNLSDTFSRVDLNDVFASAIENLRDSIDKSEAEINKTRLPTVLGNKHLLTQVFQNLLANSIKFRRVDSPRIMIDVKSRDDVWQFSVSDNGLGFEEKNRDQIFVLYKRLATKSAISGTGIGLATCRKVVERHGGTIWAQSEPGKGSTFFFTLPKHLQANNIH